MKNILLMIFTFGLSMFVGGLPAASQEYVGCDISTLSDTPTVENLAQILNNGNYQAFSEAIDIYDQWSRSQKNESADNLSQYLQGRPLSSCALLQKRQYSESFITEVVVLKFESSYLYLFVASVKMNDDWMVARLQIENSFDKIYNFIR